MALRYTNLGIGHTDLKCKEELDLQVDKLRNRQWYEHLGEEDTLENKDVVDEEGTLSDEDTETEPDEP